jgi:proliferating cell nuclear antigen
MKLMDIDADQLGIPETEYDARVSMPVAEFARIVRDLSQLGESVRIEVSKEGARFTSEGEAANGNVLLKHASGKIGKVKTKEERDDEEEEENSQRAKVKKEKDDDDVEMDEDKEGEEKGKEEFQPDSDEEGEDEQENDDEEGTSKKRKKKVRFRGVLRLETSRLSFARPMRNQNPPRNPRRKHLTTMSKVSISS